jgi:2Fe-2S ferredoxin
MAVASAPEPAAHERLEPELPGPGGKPGEPRATFVQADGEVMSVDIPEGISLMEGSVRNNLPGIIAECGGTCSCGTCHVYVDEQWRDRLHEAEFEEEDLLEFIEGRQPGSRLSCQIVMSDELDGLVVRVPAVEG